MTSAMTRIEVMDAVRDMSVFLCLLWPCRAIAVAAVPLGAPAAPAVGAGGRSGSWYQRSPDR